jgi:hypothetical protein
LGIEVSFISADSVQDYRDAIKPNTKVGLKWPPESNKSTEDNPENVHDPLQRS